MIRYIAFLRAVNVGGYTVKMEALRQVFESFGFSEVETFIASGNVIFCTPEGDAAELQRRIASGLREKLDHDIAIFLRTEAEVAQIAAYPAFPQAEIEKAVAFNVAFLERRLDPAAEQKLISLTTDIDRFAVHEREVYWLCSRRQSESTFSNAVLEKKLGLKATLRGMSTIARLVAKYALRPIQ